MGFPDLHREILGMYLSQKQYFSTRVNFFISTPPQGRFDHVWRYFGSSRLGGMPIASSRWRPETPTILQCTGQAPTTEKYQVQNVSSVKVKNPNLKQAMNLLASCNLFPLQQTAPPSPSRESFQNSLSLTHFDSGCLKGKHYPSLLHQTPAVRQPLHRPPVLCAAPFVATVDSLFPSRFTKQESSISLQIATALYNWAMVLNQG